MGNSFATLLSQYLKPILANELPHSVCIDPMIPPMIPPRGPSVMQMMKYEFMKESLRCGKPEGRIPLMAVCKVYLGAARSSASVFWHLKGFKNLISKSIS